MKIECPDFLQFPELKHAFFRGVSDNSQILERREQFPFPLITLKQVHGSHVVQVTEPWIKDHLISEESWLSPRLTAQDRGDGLVTNVKNIALGILTADCGPVLLYDPSSHTIGACHAGWRGAKAGIIQATIAAMENLGAKCSRIHAALGPTIQQENYQVGPEFPDLIGEAYTSYFYPSQNPDHHYFNLPLYVQDILKKEGVAHICDLKIDTFSGHFSSRRRSLQEGQQTFTDNLSVIAMS